MKKIVVFFVIFVVSVCGLAAQTNREAVTNTALLVRRFGDWQSQCNSYWERQFDRNNVYIGSGTYEDYVYQQGAFAGICMSLSEQIDQCISINLRMLLPNDYGWLTEEKSTLFYNMAQKGMWYNNLSEARKAIYDRGYWRGYFTLTGRKTRFGYHLYVEYQSCTSQMEAIQND